MSAIEENHTNARVFVSSIVDGFHEMREAARRGIVGAGAQPVLINEDLLAAPTSPRNACLDGVGSCDAMVLIIGQRGGWTTPSGKLVVEEEYEYARRCGLPIIVLIRDVGLDPDADRVARAASDYVEGNLRKKFTDSDELEKLVRDALTPIVTTLGTSLMSTESLDRELTSPIEIANEVVLRTVVMPVRDEEVVSPPSLASVAFKDDVLRVGHAGDPRLLEYSRACHTSSKGECFRVSQVDERGRDDGLKEVRIAIFESGLVRVDSNLTNREPSPGFGGMEMMFVTHEEAARSMRAAFSFIAGLFDSLDPHRRHTGFVYNVVLAELSFRNFVELKPTGSHSVPIGMRQGEPIVAHSKARAFSREALQNPDEEIRRTVALLHRQAEGG